MLECEFHDTLRQRRREQHIESLVRVGKPSEQIANILDEAQVEHAIRLVQNGDFDFVQLENALLEVVDDAPGRADKDIDAILYSTSLLFVVCAAVGQSNLEACVFAEQFGVLGNLHRQFPRRREHEGARLFFSLRVRGRGKQLLECRDQESCRLACAGLCLARNVSGFQGYRQSAGLDGCTELEACITDARVHAVLQRKCIKSEVAQMVI